MADLAAVSAFAGLSAAQLATIADCAHVASFERDAMLFEAGRPANAFHVITEGTVALEVAVPAGPPLIVETLHAGDVAGWSWLVPPYEWHLDGRADEPTTTVVIDAACLRGKAEADPALGYALMQRFAPIIVDRLQHTRVRLLDLYGTPGS